MLDAVGILPAARFVVFHSFDGWIDSIDMVDALHPQTLLAYGMSARAGAPAEVRPSGAPVADERGDRLSYRSEVDVVMRLFRRALEFDATSGLAHQNIGTLHLQAGDLKGAEASLREALRIDPSLAGAQTTLGVVLVKTGRGPEAVEAWTRAVDLEPTEYDALYNLTIELLAEGRIDEARRFGDQYLKTAPPALYAPDIAHLRKLLGR